MIKPVSLWNYLYLVLQAVLHWENPPVLQEVIFEEKKNRELSLSESFCTTDCIDVYVAFSFS